jgi:hypothetical protein
VCGTERKKQRLSRNRKEEGGEGKQIRKRRLRSTINSEKYVQRCKQKTDKLCDGREKIGVRKQCSVLFVKKANSGIFRFLFLLSLFYVPRGN